MRSTFMEYATLKESLVMALNAMRGSKLRSALTLLGIVVGVFSIIAVMTAMGVLRQSIEEGIADLGANTFQISKFVGGFSTSPAERRKWRNRRNITYAQALEVREKMTLAEAVGIEIWTGGKTVVWEGEKTNPNIGIGGENLEGLVTNDLMVEVGRGLTQQDIRTAPSVVILGKTVAEKLFPPSLNPVGEKVRVDGSQYQVIGVFAPKGKGLGRNQDNFAIVPITTFMRKYGSTHRSMNIMVKASSKEVFDDCVEQARGILRVARRVSPGEEDDFGYYSNDSLIKQFNEFTLYLRLGVLMVSSISLLAAGIGIMNIMLVSVTERTREIGIRKAVGARRRDILAQFIMEAIILCQIGGVLGVVFGVLGGNVVGILLEVSAVIPWDWAAIGIGICSLVGLVFGVYPAWKASTLDPIDALRYE
jgi:putative ABC transport system permease protein